MPEVLDMPIETETPKPIEQANTGTNVNELIERARTEERAKLYDSITKKENKLKESEKKAEELESKIKEFEEFKNKVELEKLDGIQKLEKEKEQLLKKIQDAEKEAKNREAVQAEKIRIYELATFKSEKIKESGLDLDFADMVFGNTEEEVLASIGKAKEKEIKLKEKFGQKIEEPISPPTTNPATPYPTLTTEPPDIRKVKTQKDLDELKVKLGLKLDV